MKTKQMRKEIGSFRFNWYSGYRWLTALTVVFTVAIFVALIYFKHNETPVNVVNVACARNVRSLLNADNVRNFDPDFASEVGSEIVRRLTEIKDALYRREQGKYMPTDDPTLTDYLMSIGYDPALLRAGFRRASEAGMSILTAADKVRLFSWKELDRGAYGQVVIYECDGSTKCKNLSDGGHVPGNFTDLRTLVSDYGQTIYLVESDGPGGNGKYVSTILAYTIVGGDFVETPIFNVDGYSTSMIETSCIDGEGIELGITEIDPDGTTITVPIIENGNFCGEYKTYIFDGSRFVEKDPTES